MGKSFVANSGANDPITGLAAGTFAIWDHGSDIDNPDDTPATDPFNNLSKVAIHSDFDYLGVSDVKTATLSIPARTNTSSVTRYDHTLVAHGFGSKPLMLVRVKFTGAGNPWVVINGEFNLGLNAFSFIFQSLIVQADATNIYVREHGIGNWAAASLDFEIYLLDRTFDTTPTLTDEVFYADPTTVRGAGGVFDTARRYLQEDTGGTPQFNSYTGQTRFSQDGTGSLIVPVTGISNGRWPGAALRTNDHPGSTSPTPGFHSLTPIPLLAPDLGGSGVKMELSASGFSITDGDDLTLFDTSRKMLAVLDEYTSTINIASHAPAAGADVVHTVQTTLGAASTGAEFIFGWLEIQTASVPILTYTPIEFSGSLVLSNSSNTDSFGYTYERTNVTVAPKIVGGNIIVEEQWWNHSLAGVTNTSTPAMTIRVHVFTAARTGAF